MPPIGSQKTNCSTKLFVGQFLFSRQWSEVQFCVIEQRSADVGFGGPGWDVSLMGVKTSRIHSIKLYIPFLLKAAL